MEIMTCAQRLSRRVFNQAPLPCKTEIAIFPLEPKKHARPIIKCHIDATHKSAVLLRDCSCGRAKKATSDRTETHHTQGIKKLR